MISSILKKAASVAVLAVVPIGVVSSASSAVRAQDRDDRLERRQRGYDRDNDGYGAGQRDRSGDRDRDRDRDQDRRRDRGRYDRGYASRVAEQRGYATGLDRGRDDARNRRSFNPNNSSHYRSGDSAYRDGFRRGYGVGYRQFGGYRGW